MVGRHAPMKPVPRLAFFFPPARTGYAVIMGKLHHSKPVSLDAENVHVAEQVLFQVQPYSLVDYVILIQTQGRQNITEL